MPDIKRPYRFKYVQRMEGDQFGIVFNNDARRRTVINFRNKDLEKLIRELREIQNRPRRDDEKSE